MITLKHTIIVGLFVLLIANPTKLYGQGNPKVKTGKDIRSTKQDLAKDSMQVEKAADCFISLFRRNLDFGDAFEALFVSDSIKRMRKANFFSSMNFDDILVKTSDNVSLERTYKALMNFYYLKAIYDLCDPIDVNHSGDSLPIEIRAALEKSKYLNVLLEGVSDDGLAVKTRQDMQRFIGDYEQLAGLYKKHLPSNPFDSKIYINNIDKGDNSVRVRYGYPEYGVGSDVKVYMLKRDIFDFFFIKEKNEMRILTLGMGN